MEIRWDTLAEDAWTDRLAAAGASPLQQSWRYGAVAAGMGARVGRALVRDGAREVAVAQVLARRGMRAVLRGPVWLDCDDADHRRAVLRRLARVPAPFVATPGERVAGAGLVPLITPRHHALWDLTPGPDALRAAMAPKWRADLVRAEGAGLHLSAAPQGLEALIAAETAQRGARRYRALPPEVARAWGHGSRVLCWRDGERTEAAVQVLVHCPWASYHLAWASETGRKARALWAMLWAMALLLKAQGVTTLDLGDVDTEAAPGLARFKLGTGARLARLGATCLVLPG
ncbi:MAG: GNAT family N-acetyltransferase [Gemmobacter sp.]